MSTDCRITLKIHRTVYLITVRTKSNRAVGAGLIVCGGFVQILVVMLLLMRIIHLVPALAGLAVTIILVPITTVVSRRLKKVRAALIKCTDDRVKLVTEVITGKLLGGVICITGMACQINEFQVSNISCKGLASLPQVKQ